MNRRQSIVSAVVVLVVAAAGLVGVEVNESALADVVGAVMLLAAYGWGIWRNHNFTDAALEAQASLNIAKATVPRNIYGNEDEEEL